HAGRSWTIWSRSHEPYALEAKVICTFKLDYLVSRVRGVLHRCPFDWLKLRIPGIGDLHLSRSLGGFDRHRCRNLRQQYCIFRFLGSRDCGKDCRCRTTRRDFGEVSREIRRCVSPWTLQVRCAEPSTSSQIVKLLRRFVHEHYAACVRCILKLRIRNLRVNRLTVEQNDFSRLVAVENPRRRTLGISRWWDKFLEAAPLFILRHFGHIVRRLFDQRPWTSQL